MNILAKMFVKTLPIFVLLTKQAVRPILECLRIYSNIEGVFAEATDLETVVRIRLTDEFDLQENSSILVNTQELKRILSLYKGLPKYINVTCDFQVVTVKIDDKKLFRLSNIPRDEFPNLNYEPLNRTLTVSSDEFFDGLKRVLPYVEPLDRYGMHNVSLENDGDTLQIVGTDSSRLAIAKAGCEGSIDCRISKEAVEILMKAREHFGETQITIYESEKRIAFQTPNIFISTLKRNEIFPDWRKVMPKHMNTLVTFDRSSLLEGLERAKAMTKETYQKVIFEINSDIVKLICADSLGEMEEEPCDYGIVRFKDPIRVCVNPSYIIDALKGSHAITVDIEFEAKSEPILISENRFTSLIMPINI